MAYNLTQSLDLESGSSQYAQITSVITGFPSGNTNQTVEAWVKFESFPADNVTMFVVAYGEDGNNNSAFSLAVINRSTVIKGYVDVFGADAEGNVSLGLSLDTWHHFAVRYNGTNIIWTVDGVDVDTEGAPTIDTNVTRAGVGGRTELATVSNFFDGKLSLARVWSEARSQAQLSANMCNVLGSTTNLAAEWTLDNVYTDNSGNSNTISPTNSPVFGADVPAVCATATEIRYGRFSTLLGVGT